MLAPVELALSTRTQGSHEGISRCSLIMLTQLPKFTLVQVLQTLAIAVIYAAIAHANPIPDAEPADSEALPAKYTPSDIYVGPGQNRYPVSRILPD